MRTGAWDNHHHRIPRRRLEITMASTQSCYSHREIFHRNNSKPERTARPTQALSRKVPRTAFQQQQAKDAEIKSPILLTCRATSLRHFDACILQMQLRLPLSAAGAEGVSPHPSAGASPSHPFGCSGAAAPRFPVAGAPAPVGKQ